MPDKLRPGVPPTRTLARCPGVNVCRLAGGEIGDLDAAPLNIDVSALLRDWDVEPRALDDRRHERRLDREVRRVL